MNIFKNIASAFKNWLDFKGRASRGEYWSYTLFMMIFGLLFSAGLIVLFLKGNALWLDSALGMIVFGIVNLYITILGIFLSTRRLHDINKSGWWQLLSLTIVGLPVVFYWYLKPADKGENRFGANPLNK